LAWKLHCRAAWNRWSVLFNGELQSKFTDSKEAVMQTVTGMVQYCGLTYRLVRLSPGVYEVVRIADDAKLGRFESGPPIRVIAHSGDGELLQQVARLAVRQARTSWMRLAVA
jgi:hypothetical protein